jgi:hypothetical protein
VGVLQAGGGLGLVLEALQLPGVERRGERQHLQGDAAAQRQLLRLVDDAHAAPAHLADQAEVAQRRRTLRGAGRRGRRPGGVHAGQAEQLQRRQHLPQQGGDARVAGGVLLDRRPLAPVEPLREFVGDLAHQRLDRRPFRRRRLVHGGDSIRPLSTSSFRSRSRARP